MEIGKFKKLDQKNRVHIPLDIMAMLKMPNNSEVYISCVVGEDYIRVYPKSYVDKQMRLAKESK